MELRTYLKERGETVAAFADRANRPVETVRNWVYRQKSPSLEAAAHVESLTEGAVTAAELIVPRIAA
jgi:DNA-binding transcriptional regulator YiaG